MSAIELYYSTLPTPAGPYYAGDDEDDTEMTEEEQAIFEEQMYRDF